MDESSGDLGLDGFIFELAYMKPEQKEQQLVSNFLVNSSLVVQALI